jgi:hypothetical protein
MTSLNIATDNQQSTTVLLRKSIVLALQLKNERLKVWATNELNGYSSWKEMPEYRIISAGAVGTFVGPGWAQTHQGIPSAVLKEQHRKFAETVYFGQPIKTMEHLLESSGDTISFPWDHNLVVQYQDELLSAWTLVSACQKIPKSVIAGISDTVRTRVLNMALEIQTEIGKTDAELEHVTPQAAEKVERSVVNNIYGGNVYVSGGNSTLNATTIQQHQHNIVAGDWEHLSQVLRSAGVSEPELGELSAAVKQDGQKWGPKVKDWIAKTAPQVLSGGVKIGASIGQTLLVEYLKQYYGLS